MNHSTQVGGLPCSSQVKGRLKSVNLISSINYDNKIGVRKEEGLNIFSTRRLCRGKFVD